MKIRYVISMHSITGAKKKQGKENQDSSFIIRKRIPGKKKDMAVLAGVADGMGGLSNGKLASSRVEERLTEWFESGFEELMKLGIRSFSERLKEEILKIHEELRKLAKEKGEEMGSTLALLFVRGTTYVVANIGDSRIYMLQGGEMEQLTHDQTVMQRDIDNGLEDADNIDPKDRRVHTLLQAIGASEKIEPHIFGGKTGEQYLFFLCSDGMINRVDKKELKEVLISDRYTTEKKKIKELMKLALRRGESDNMTGIVVKKFDPDNPEIVSRKVTAVLE